MWVTTLNETSRLTIELRDIVDNGDNSVDIWDFEYPTYYTGEEKSAFERKVIDHYYFRQIGSETVGRFLHQFRTRIREIMPYYIEMYRTQEIMSGIEDPFGNVDIVETFEQETSETSQNTQTINTEGSTSTNGKTDTTRETDGSENKEHRFSNTPQGSISNLDNYLTEASKDTDTTNESVTENSASESTGTSSDTSETSGTGSSSGTLKHTFTKKGNQGVNTYAHDMVEFRKSIINVDMMIINELNDLFLGVY